MEPDYLNFKQKWRDGHRHTIGPISLQFTHTGDGGPSAYCTIETAPEAIYHLDYHLAEAIAFCILPTADLWRAFESDKEVQRGTKEQRGWLRLVVTGEEKALKELTGWAEHVFQIGRLVLDAGVGEVVRPAKNHRATDYRRAALRKGGGAAKSDTRMSFIQCCSALAKAHHADLPEQWKQEAKGRFWAADQTSTYEEETTK